MVLHGRLCFNYLGPLQSGVKKMADWFIYALLTSLCWACLPFLEKGGIQAIDDLFAAAFLRCCGAMLGALFIPLFAPSAYKALLTAPPRAYICLMAAGFIGSFIGQLTNLQALKLGEVSKVVPVTASWPLLAVCGAFIFLGEPVTAKKVCGALLVVSGVVLARI